MHLLEFPIIGFCCLSHKHHTQFSIPNVVVRIKTRVPFSIDCTAMVIHNTTREHNMVCTTTVFNLYLYLSPFFFVQFFIKYKIKMTNRIFGLFVTCKLDK